MLDLALAIAYMIYDRGLVLLFLSCMVSIIADVLEETEC